MTSIPNNSANPAFDISLPYLIFVRDDGVNFSIWRSKADGTELKMIPFSSFAKANYIGIGANGDISKVSLSPSRKHILIPAYTNALAYELWILAYDGSVLTRLLTNSGQFGTFRSDTTVFYGSPESTTSNVFRIDIDGTNNQLSFNGNAIAGRTGTTMVHSNPTQTFIYFACMDGGAATRYICKANYDGTGGSVISTTAYYYNVIPNHTDSLLATRCSTSLGGCSTGMKTMNTDGSGGVVVPNFDITKFVCAWHMDDTRLYYHDNISKNIFLIDKSGTGSTQITFTGDVAESGCDIR